MVACRFLRRLGSRVSIPKACRPVPLGTSLRVNPMPPRITRKSYRPRVSDRTMVDTSYNRQGLHRFQDRVASSPPENRTTNKMENKINQAVRGTPEPSVSRGRSGGWKSRNFSQLPVGGEIFLLTFPFIEQAVTRLTGGHSHRRVEYRRSGFSPPVAVYTIHYYLNSALSSKSADGKGNWRI